MKHIGAALPKVAAPICFIVSSSVSKILAEAFLGINNVCPLVTCDKTYRCSFT
jgi:hypothetical protein